MNCWLTGSNFYQFPLGVLNNTTDNQIQWPRKFKSSILWSEINMAKIQEAFYIAPIAPFKFLRVRAVKRPREWLPISSKRNSELQNSSWLRKSKLMKRHCREQSTWQEFRMLFMKSEICISIIKCKWLRKSERASSFLRQRALCSHSEGVSSPRARECFTLGDFHWQFTYTYTTITFRSMYGFTQTANSLYINTTFHAVEQRWALGSGYIDLSPGALKEANHYSWTCQVYVRARWIYALLRLERETLTKLICIERNWLVSYKLAPQTTRQPALIIHRNSLGENKGF